MLFRARLSCLIFYPLLKIWVLYTYFPAKNTVTYFQKVPSNPHKIKISSIASKQSQHGLRQYYECHFAFFKFLRIGKLIKAVFNPFSYAGTYQQSSPIRYHHPIYILSFNHLVFHIAIIPCMRLSGL